MEKFKVGVVGCGGIARLAHLPALAKNKDVEVVGVCDLIEARMDEADKILGYKPAHYTDYKKLIASGIDSLHICLPNYLHSIVAVEALNAGINVFCEKPDAISVADALKMQDAEQRSGKRLMVMRNNRHNVAGKLAKSYVDSGEVGEVYCGRCGWIRRRGIPGKGGWFTTKAQSGGGPLIDLGVHMIDLAIYLMGNPTPVSVSGCVFSKFSGSDESDSVHSSFGTSVENGIFDVEDLAMGFIRFEGGQCLQVEFSWASNIEKETNFVELRGTKAGINISNGEFKLIAERAGELLEYRKEPMPDNGHALNIKHFYNVLNGKCEPDFVIQQGVNMIKILSAMYKSAETGREVIL